MNNCQFWIDHFRNSDTDLKKLFLSLTPDSCGEVLKDLNVSNANGIRHQSAENQVFEFKDVVVKFYRPGRWSFEALQDELQFLEDLCEANVPFVRPIGGVRVWNGLYYIVFESVSKPYEVDREVLDEKSVKQMVQLVAQIHKVGAKRSAPNRAQFDPVSMCAGCFEVIEKSGYIPNSLKRNYRNAMDELIKKFERIGNIPVQRIHGDTYSGNVIWTSTGPVFMDLDDFQVGPTAMDIKLLSFPWRLDTLPEEMDRRERRKIQHQLVLDCYRETQEFPKQLEAIFPLLTVYRDIQFDAWFSSRWKDPGFARNYADDDICDPAWWKDSIDGLEESLSNT